MEKFSVNREEFVTKTFRIPKSLADELESICDKKNISLNKLIVECAKYALKNFDEKENNLDETK